MNEGDFKDLEATGRLKKLIKASKYKEKLDELLKEKHNTNFHSFDEFIGNFREWSETFNIFWKLAKVLGNLQQCVDNL